MESASGVDSSGPDISGGLGAKAKAGSGVTYQQITTDTKHLKQVENGAHYTYRFDTQGRSPFASCPTREVAFKSVSSRSLPGLQSPGF